MAKQSEELIDEAHDKLNDDRAKMKEFIDLLIQGVQVGESIDPLAKIALTDAFAKMSGELTKNTSLLVELAKLRSKKELFKKPSDGFDDEETDGMFDEIEHSPENEEDPN